MDHTRASITDIQRYSVHDGPGIRTVVFFKGCPLRCKWCQNPETQYMKKLVMFNPELCVGCGKCVEICPNHAIDPVTGLLDRDKCTACGTCLEGCYAGARTIPGDEMSLDEVFDTVCLDEVFYKNSGGGVTLSGGEVTMHADAASKLLRRCKARGISTAIETCGFCAFSELEKLLPYVDYYLYDIKLMDGERHREYTGQPNAVVHDNLRRLGKLGKTIIIRIPFIPTVNDSEENLRQTAELAREVNAMEVHLLPFHQIGESKWNNLGFNYTFHDYQPPSEKLLEQAADILREYGLRVNIGGLGEYSTEGGISK